MQTIHHPIFDNLNKFKESHEETNEISKKNILLTLHTLMLLQMGQGIQEWTKQNLWKTFFKKFEVIWSA